MNQGEVGKWQGDNKGKVLMLHPLVMEVGRAAFNDEKLMTKLNKLLIVAQPKISENDLDEQTAFAILAIKKYKITIEEAWCLIMQVKALDYCFEKYVNNTDILETVKEQFGKPVDANTFH